MTLFCSFTPTYSKSPTEYKKHVVKDTLWQELKNFEPKKYRQFFIIIPSYNNKDWYKRNLDSVFIQDYPFYKVVYVDDFSQDRTGDLVGKYIKEKDLEHKILLVKNDKRMLALANIYSAIHTCGKDDDIGLVLDGDDWFAHDHVLSLINKVYDKYDIWMTYGQHERYPLGDLGIARKLPDNIIKTNSFRDYKWVTSQQRTFYVWLFKLIKKEDLLYDGGFFPVTGDLAVMFPMLEMAGTRSMFIQDVIYIYNRATQLNNSKVNPGFSFGDVIRKRKRYNLLEKRPV